MPILDGNEIGNLYVTIKVIIPEFTDRELGELEGFFGKMVMSDE